MGILKINKFKKLKNLTDIFEEPSELAIFDD